MNQYLILFTLLFVLTGKCQKSDIIDNHFTKQESQELNSLLSFFQSEVCGEADFISCINENRELLSEDPFNHFSKLIDFNAQKKMFDGLSPELFNEIWKTCNGPERNGTRKQYLCVKDFESKYIDYLSEVGEKIPYIKNYVDWLISAGDIGSRRNFNGLFFSKVDDSLLSDYDLRLILTIHFLTLNYSSHQLRAE